jgi:chemotaxis protein MotD
LNALGITNPTPRAPVDAAGTRTAGADAPDATGPAFVALLGALKGAAAPEDKPAEADGPPAKDEARGSAPGATAEPAKPLDLLAAFNAALPPGTGPAPLPARDALDVLVARAMPASVPNPDPLQPLTAPTSAPPQAAGPADPAERAILPGKGADDVPGQTGAAAPVPEARTRATILRRETHFAPVLPRLLAGSPGNASVGRPAPLGAPIETPASPDAGALPTLAPMAAALSGPAPVHGPTAPTTAPPQPARATPIPIVSEVGLGAPLPAPVSPDSVPDLPTEASSPVASLLPAAVGRPPEAARASDPAASSPAPASSPRAVASTVASPDHGPADPRAAVLPVAVAQAEAEAAPPPGLDEENPGSVIRQPASDAPMVAAPRPAATPPADAPVRPARVSARAPMPDADPAPRPRGTPVAAGPAPAPEASSPALPRPAPIANAAPGPALPAGTTAGVAASDAAPSQPASAEPPVGDAPAPGLGVASSDQAVATQALRVSPRPIPEKAPAPVALGSPTGHDLAPLQEPASGQEPASSQDLPVRPEPALPSSVVREATTPAGDGLSSVVPSVPRAPARPLPPGERVDPAMRQVPDMAVAGPSAARSRDVATPGPAVNADFDPAAIVAEPPARMPPERMAQAAAIGPRAEGVATPSVEMPVAATLGGPPPAALPETRRLSPEPAVPDGVARAEAGMPVSPPSLRDSEAGPQRAEVRRSQGGETPPLGEPASPGPSATDPGGQPALGAPSAPLMGQGLAEAPAQAASAPPAQQVAAAILGQMPSASPGAVPGASGIEGPLRLLTLQLHPADLGVVLVRMRLRDGRIEMSLHAAREETATLLREGGEVLADLLRQGGYQPERVTITSGSPSNGPVPGEGQAFQAQAEAGANPDHATPGQPDRRQPDGRAAAPETSERNHESVPSSPDRSGVYL